MNWIIGFAIAAVVLVPMFIQLWRTDTPLDKEDAKVLLGALD